ncbi:head completion/stabilization protein [Yersinia ruckeri]|uniref:head completion/stabilization protein n=1 Tax=Yersinia ruckeri TaxID=29486 RepID=UPI0005E3AD5B|nr:head completion/stabilization protein [Yersinia ruckeri]AKA39886.1 head completion/stabilization protein [Yersinia ruckeri]EKN3361000.1 head completion/stabilization protein [Yersinia ruckeri]EKN4199051.1 head completion/stabilization protein [Yersinia ruckeri]EKN4200797.1 head completion/stabilization protein [Yersinia ruckeri]EKN4205510.1 head completion/stabilization protein [Yersinia ruckeri]
MTTVVIPAPRPTQEAEPVIENTFFWPDIDPKQLRELLRYEGTVTPVRLRFAIRSAIAEVNAELFEYRRDQIAAGYPTLAEVPGDQIDGESVRTTEYLNAVSAITAATLAERYRGYDASARGDKRADAIDSTVDNFWRDARNSISNVMGKPHCIIGLI